MTILKYYYIPTIATLPVYHLCSIINLLYYIRRYRTIACTICTFVTVVIVYNINDQFLRGKNLIAMILSDFLRIFVHVYRVILKTTPVTAIEHYVITAVVYDNNNMISVSQP